MCKFHLKKVHFRRVEYQKSDFEPLLLSGRRAVCPLRADESVSAQEIAFLHCGATGGADVYLDTGDRLPVSWGKGHKAEGDWNFVDPCWSSVGSDSMIAIPFSCINRQKSKRKQLESYSMVT